MASEFFFESHYYAGGQKYFSFGQRPLWAPQADRVGVSQDAGVAIRQGDYILEVTRQNEQGSPVFWVGLFEKGVDKVYGDRGENTCGIGIWIKDALLLNPEEVAEILHKLVTHQTKLSDPKSMSPTIDKAMGHVKTASRTNLPPELKSGKDGISFGSGVLHKTILWHAQVPNYGFELYSQIGNFINLFQFMNRNFIEGNKLYLVISKDPLSAYKGVTFSGSVPSPDFEFNQELATMVLAMAEHAHFASTKPGSSTRALEEKLQNSEQEARRLRAKLEATRKNSGSTSIEQLSYKIDQLLSANKRPSREVSVNRQSQSSGDFDWAIIAIFSFIFIATFTILGLTWYDAHKTSNAVSLLIQRIEELPSLSTDTPEGQTSTLGAQDIADAIPPNFIGEYAEVPKESDKAPACSTAAGSAALKVSEREITSGLNGVCKIVEAGSRSMYKCSPDQGIEYDFSEANTVIRREGGKSLIYKRCELPSEK